MRTKKSQASEIMPLFQEMADNQQKRDDKIEQYVTPHLKSAVLPTPRDVRDAINSLVGEKRQQVLCHHKYWKEWALRQGLESLIRASHQASIDICRHDATLGALAGSKDFQNRIDHAVGYSAQKDVVAYCALALGVKDTLKEIRGIRDDIADEISKAEDKVFCADISEFIRKLRNNLLHGRVLVPEWSVSHDVERQTTTGSMMYSKKRLVNSGKWNKEARNYIQSSDNENLCLAEVVREHFGLLNGLGRTLDDLFSRNISEAEKDYWEIEDSHKRTLRSQRVRVLVEQAAKGKDPYEYLHWFFDQETVRKILSFPHHSKEQVDFMITLKSTGVD